METLYEKLASDIEQQIKNGVLKCGDKLPSLRVLHQQSGLSISTVMQSMYLLESKGLVMARPKSGYFVNYHLNGRKVIPVVSQPKPREGELNIEDFIQKVYGQPVTDQRIVNFSVGVPAAEMLPIQKLKKIIHQVVRTQPDAVIPYESIIGNERLRRQIAKRTLLWEKSLQADDLVTTTGCMNALAYALMSITKRGDTVLVESPVYFGSLQLAKSLGLQVIEMPTHSQLGIDLEAFERYIRQHRVAACIVVSNFSNPMGYCMPPAHKRQLVQLCTHYQVSLIEEDLYGDVYFGEERPLSCKSIDEAGIVIWCSSVSKTLVPGYRVGWIAPGKFKEQVLKTKLYHSVAAPSLTHEVVAAFMDKGRYDSHLRNLRVALQHNLLKYLQVINEYFPDGTKTTHPEGGFMLWLELDKAVDTSELYEEALAKGIKFAPGRMFTLRDQFSNCLRLSYGLNWNKETESALINLGKLMSRKR